MSVLTGLEDGDHYGVVPCEWCGLLGETVVKLFKEHAFVFIV